MSTKIADIIEPAVFAPYIIAQTSQKSNLIQSGIIAQNEVLNSLVTRGGRTITMPVWGRIGGDSEVLSDDTPLTVGQITSKKDTAATHFRGKAWGANELAGALAGSSVLEAIGSQIAEYWVREEQKVFISTVKGVFKSAGMTGHVLDRSTDSISAKMTLDAKQLLGDAATQLSVMVMHSAVYTELQKQNLVEYIPNARGEVLLPAYLGYRVIQDDTVPVDENGVYDTYLFANGAFARGDGLPVDLTPVETDRDSLKGDDIIVNRRAFVLHPMGVAWKGTAAGVSPTNAELEVGANWERVYDAKNIGMVLLKHKL